MGSNVLPQVTECGEVLAAALRFTVKRFPCVKPLMCFQPAKCPGEMSHAEGTTHRAPQCQPDPLWGQRTRRLHQSTLAAETPPKRNAEMQWYRGVSINSSETDPFGLKSWP